MVKFLQVVDEAKELPLALYFLFSSKTKAVELFVGADIAKYRFNGGHSVAVYVLTFRAVDSVLHPVGVGRRSI